MKNLAVEAFISMIEMPEERRSGLDRRLKDVGAMDEKRSGEDRREDFQPINRPKYYKDCLLGLFEQYMNDHDREIPIILKTDGQKVISGPLRIIKDWLGWDLEKVDLSTIYVDPASRLKVLTQVKQGEFTRFFPHIYKANGETTVFDVLLTVKISPEGEKHYFCFVSLAD